MRHACHDMGSESKVQLKSQIVIATICYAWCSSGHNAYGTTYTE